MRVSSEKILHFGPSYWIRHFEFWNFNYRFISDLENVW